MHPLSAINAIADYLTAIDHEIIHATQECVYFFFVVFLVDLELWPGSWVSYGLGGLLVTLAFFRILYYLVPYFVQNRLASLLTLEDRLAIVSAHENRSHEALEGILRRYLRRVSAERLVELLLRHDGGKLRQLLEVD